VRLQHALAAIEDACREGNIEGCTSKLELARLGFREGREAVAAHVERTAVGQP
jgi:hypothetical protein